MNVRQERDLYKEEMGDLLTTYLETLGVEYVFGVPGGAIEPFVNALARSERRGGIRHVVSRHETGAAFMAAGYHSQTGKLGVCYATTGPGATNLVTGVASAYANNIPLLVITAQTALNTFGRCALQESSCTGINTLAIFESITRYNTLVSHPDQFEHKLAAAIITTQHSPSGPAHLSIPADVMKSLAQRVRQYPDLSQLLVPDGRVDHQALDSFMRLLREARQPVFVLGNDAAVAARKICALAARLGIPVVTTPHGKGLVDPRDPLYRGVIGFAGHTSAVDTLRDPKVDLVVVIGSSLGEWASNGWDRQTLLNERLVHMSSQNNHFLDSPMARLHLRGDVDLIFTEITRRLEGMDWPRMSREYRVREFSRGEYAFSQDDPGCLRDNRAPILPQRVMAALPSLFPAHTRYFADSGNSLAWAVHYLHPPSLPLKDGEVTKSPFFGSFDFSSMGWAIACSVGAALGLGGNTPVVCITGDGSYLMSSQEITVAIQHQLPVVYLILNDAGYGMVKHGQRLTGAEPEGYELPFIDYAALARSMGVASVVIESMDDLLALDTDSICSRAGPTLLDVRIDAEARPPIHLRTRILQGQP